jgi:hypothetical protein
LTSVRHRVGIRGSASDIYRALSEPERLMGWWPVYLLSLRDLIETGKGRPSPNDIPIFVGDSVSSNTV